MVVSPANPVAGSTALPRVNVPTTPVAVAVSDLPPAGGLVPSGADWPKVSPAVSALRPTPTLSCDPTRPICGSVRDRFVTVSGPSLTDATVAIGSGGRPVLSGSRLKPVGANVSGAASVKPGVPSLASESWKSAESPTMSKTRRLPAEMPMVTAVAAKSRPPPASSVAVNVAATDSPDPLALLTAKAAGPWKRTTSAASGNATATGPAGPARAKFWTAPVVFRS